MLKQFKLDMKLHWDSILLKLFVPVGGLVMGIVLVIMILLLDKESTYVCLGTAFGLGFNGFLGMIWSISFPQELMLALSMGRTRREFLLSYALRALIAQAGIYALILLGYQVEIAVYTALFPGLTQEFRMEPLLYNGWVIAVSTVGMVLLQMFFGVLYGRFGKSFQGIAYILWMGTCILGPQAFNSESPAGQVFRAVLSTCGQFPAAFWILVLMCAVAAIGAGILILGQKQMVK